MKHKAILHSDLRCLLEVATAARCRASCIAYLPVYFSGSAKSSTALLFLFLFSATKTFACGFISNLFYQKRSVSSSYAALLRPASNRARSPRGSLTESSGMISLAAGLTSVASARSSPRTYRHTGTGSSVPYSTLMGALGLFRRHMDSAIFSA